MTDTSVRIPTCVGPRRLGLGGMRISKSIWTKEAQIDPVGLSRDLIVDIDSVGDGFRINPNVLGALRRWAVDLCAQATSLNPQAAPLSDDLVSWIHDRPAAKDSWGLGVLRPYISDRRMGALRSRLLDDRQEESQHSRALLAIELTRCVLEAEACAGRRPDTLPRFAGGVVSRQVPPETFVEQMPGVYVDSYVQPLVKSFREVRLGGGHTGIGTCDLRLTRQAAPVFCIDDRTRLFGELILQVRERGAALISARRQGCRDPDLVRTSVDFYDSLKNVIQTVEKAIADFDEGEISPWA